jgi:hypothetical protein
MKRLSLFLLGLLLSPAIAGSTDWFVSPDSTADFVFIQDAIDAAGHGDRILVRPGTYVERLNLLGKIIELIGEEGPEQTIVDADQSGSGLTVPFTSGEGPLIRGLTFTNGIGTILRSAPRDGRFGGGAWIESASPRFEDCHFVGNTANNGGGVFVLSAAPEFVRCVFSENAAGTGGGVAIEHDAGVALLECEIRDNLAVFGGGLDLFHSRANLESSIVAGNTATEGGAMRIRSSAASPVRITGSILVENSDSDCAAGICASDANLVLEGSTIAGNNPGPASVAVHLTDSAATISSTVIAAESAGLFDCSGGMTQLDCVVLWHPHGLGEGCGDGDRVLFADPLFCDPEGGDYSLAGDSPCLPGQGPAGCGLIGAIDLGCDSPVPIQVLRWGRLRLLFH